MYTHIKIFQSRSRSTGSKKLIKPQSTSNLDIFSYDLIRGKSWKNDSEALNFWLKHPMFPVQYWGQFLNECIEKRDIKTITFCLNQITSGTDRQKILINIDRLDYYAEEFSMDTALLHILFNSRLSLEKKVCFDCHSEFCSCEISKNQKLVITNYAGDNTKQLRSYNNPIINALLDGNLMKLNRSTFSPVCRYPIIDPKIINWEAENWYKQYVLGSISHSLINNEYLDHDTYPDGS